MEFYFVLTVILLYFLSYIDSAEAGGDTKDTAESVVRAANKIYGATNAELLNAYIDFYYAVKEVKKDDLIRHKHLVIDIILIDKAVHCQTHEIIAATSKRNQPSSAEKTSKGPNEPHPLAHSDVIVRTRGNPTTELQLEMIYSMLPRDGQERDKISKKFQNRPAFLLRMGFDDAEHGIHLESAEEYLDNLIHYQLLSDAPSLEVAISLHELKSMLEAFNSSTKTDSTNLQLKLAFAIKYYFNNYMWPITLIDSSDMTHELITRPVLKRLKFIYYDRDVIYAFRCAQYILHNVVAELVYILIRFLATQELKDADMVISEERNAEIFLLYDYLSGQSRNLHQANQALRTSWRSIGQIKTFIRRLKSKSSIHIFGNAGIAMLPQLVKEISNENIKSASALEIDLKELIETIRDSKFTFVAGEIIALAEYLPIIEKAQNHLSHSQVKASYQKLKTEYGIDLTEIRRFDSQIKVINERLVTGTINNWLLDEMVIVYTSVGDRRMEHIRNFHFAVYSIVHGMWLGAYDTVPYHLAVDIFRLYRLIRHEMDAKIIGQLAFYENRWMDKAIAKISELYPDLAKVVTTFERISELLHVPDRLITVTQANQSDIGKQWDLKISEAESEATRVSAPLASVTIQHAILTRAKHIQLRKYLQHNKHLSDTLNRFEKTTVEIKNAASAMKYPIKPRIGEWIDKVHGYLQDVHGTNNQSDVFMFYGLLYHITADQIRSLSNYELTEILKKYGELQTNMTKAPMNDFKGTIRQLQISDIIKGNVERIAAKVKSAATLDY